MEFLLLLAVVLVLIWGTVIGGVLGLLIAVSLVVGMCLFWKATP